MQLKTHPIPNGSPGTTTELTIWHYTQGLEGPKVYLQAGLHADEWPGILTLHHLHQLLNKQIIYGEIVIVPYANPIGMRQFLGGYQLGRFDFDYSGNFNRGYLDMAERAQQYLNKESLVDLPQLTLIKTIRQAFKQALDDWQPTLESEHLRKALQLLSYDADYVLDLHCDAQACVHAFVNQRHQSTGEMLAECLDAKALILEDNPGGMAFDDAMASAWWRLADKLELNLPNATFSATIELRGERDMNDNYAQADANNLLNFLGAIGSIAKTTTQIIDGKNTNPIGTPLSGVARILAPHTGLVVFHVKAGEYVHEHALVAEVVNINEPDKARTALFAPTEGVVYALGRNHLIRTGHVVAQIAGKKPIGEDRLAF